MKYFDISPEDFLTAQKNGRSVAEIIEGHYNDDLADLQVRREILLGALKDIPFDYDVDFHSYEPHISIPWDDRDPVEVLGLASAIWKKEGEKIAWNVEWYETVYRHVLTGLKLMVRKVADLPGATYAIYRNTDDVRYVGKIVQVSLEEAEAEVENDNS